ncbi:MAG: carbonic anhydrase family protein [Gordonia sp. (in: high G+C Gram-positive bacteria)]|uniref:carbonic anhydrase n=1 Tax=Gordonia sp. (in: high G+C Gram-positive bacteria) TaxID=84139 RepID=UPI0039E31793
MTFPTRLLAPLALASVIVLAGCSSSTDIASPESSSPHWSYGGKGGPEHWDDLSPSFGDCDDVERQSPIDLPAQVPASTAHTVVALKAAAEGAATDTGHSEEFAPDQPVTTVTVDGAEYVMKQMHFHTPSEHTIAGRPAAAEFHFVHETAEGSRLVLAVLAQQGAPVHGMDQFLDAVDAHEKKPVALNFGEWLPAAGDYYAYEGSLTTPPCTEHVKWMVLSTPVTLSANQLGRLEALHGANARPVNPVGDRRITGGRVEIERR